MYFFDDQLYTLTHALTVARILASIHTAPIPQLFKMQVRPINKANSHSW